MTKINLKEAGVLIGVFLMAALVISCDRRPGLISPAPSPTATTMMTATSTPTSISASPTITATATPFIIIGPIIGVHIFPTSTPTP